MYIYYKPAIISSGIIMSSSCLHKKAFLDGFLYNCPQIDKVFKEACDHSRQY